MRTCSPLVALIVAAVASTTALPAQNLLKWDGWKAVNPKYLGSQGLQVTNTEIRMWPYEAALPNRTLRTGFTQTVTVAKAGTYQFNIAGWNDDGGWRFQVKVGSRVLWLEDNWQWMGLGKTVFLPAGKTEVTFLTHTINMTGPGWKLVQPTLIPAIEPTVDIYFLFGGLSSGRCRLTTNANLLAVSLGRLQNPIPIPGLGHGLLLDPTTLMILAMSSSGNIAEKLDRAAQGLSVVNFPRIYVQAATWKQLGSLGWL